MLRRRGWLLRGWQQHAFLKKRVDKQTKSNPDRVLFLKRKSTLSYFALVELRSAGEELRIWAPPRSAGVPPAFFKYLVRSYAVEDFYE